MRSATSSPGDARTVQRRELYFSLLSSFLHLPSEDLADRPRHVWSGVSRYGRDTKSIDTSKQCCGRCKGRLIALFVDTSATPAKPNAYRGVLCSLFPFTFSLALCPPSLLCPLPSLSSFPSGRPSSDRPLPPRSIRLCQSTLRTGQARLAWLEPQGDHAYFGSRLEGGEREAGRSVDEAGWRRREGGLGLFDGEAWSALSRLMALFD
jgi:hypothetical protein